MGFVSEACDNMGAAAITTRSRRRLAVSRANRGGVCLALYLGLLADHLGNVALLRERRAMDGVSLWLTATRAAIVQQSAVNFHLPWWRWPAARPRGLPCRRHRPPAVGTMKAWRAGEEGNTV